MGGDLALATPFSYAVVAVVSFMQGDYASLELLVLLVQAKRTRHSPPIACPDPIAIGLSSGRRLPAVGRRQGGV